MFSVQRKASIQEAMTGDIGETRRREVGEELVEVEREIQEAIMEQEKSQKIIDEHEQDLQRTSRQQAEGREGELYWAWDVFGFSGDTSGTYMVPAVSAHTR